MINQLTSISLLQKSTTENLYIKLIEQLNKDYQFANINEAFSTEVTPEQLYTQLTKSLLNLINTHYDAYLNLLYRVDVSETDLAKLKGGDVNVLIPQVAFYVLKRIYQKVWLKANYKR